MKKLLAYLLIIGGIGLMFMATSVRVMEHVSGKRSESDKWWGVHFPVEGDLVGMSYLYFEKRFYKKGEMTFDAPSKDCATPANLFVWGDSYAAFVPDTAFGCASSYKYGRRFFGDLKFHLDTAQRNVLIVEIAERYVRSYFSSTDMYGYVRDTFEEGKTSFIPNEPYQKVRYATFDVPDINKLFNERINQNLEYHLFNYNFINPVRMAKAWFNYRYFNRASGDVAVSQNGKYLLLKETIAPNRTESSFAAYDKEEFSKVINILNEIDAHYKALGFDEVYLSMIPNPVTIIEPERYNGLIPALQTDERLKMKCIDMYKPFSKTTKEVYERGDSHWNNAGVKMWVDEVNTILRK